MYAPLDLDDVQYADVVVVGTNPTTASSLIPMYASAINRSSPETLNLTKQPRSRQASFPISPISDRGRWGLAGSTRSSAFVVMGQFNFWRTKEPAFRAISYCPAGPTFSHSSATRSVGNSFAEPRAWRFDIVASTLCKAVSVLS